MAESRRFEGKSAIVTGAASGFGKAIAARFAGEGARVVVADIDGKGAGAVAAAIRHAGGEAVSQPTDVSSSFDVGAMVEAAVENHGRLDVLVNNAGIAHRGMFIWELAEEEYDTLFATNTKSVYLGAKYAAPVMKEQGGGVIVNTASIGASAPRPRMTVYNATKGAVVTMTRGLAVELAQFNIRVNAVNPVAADTNFMKAALGADSMSDRIRQNLIDSIPLGRLTEPSDVASAVLFLASDEAAFLTGVCLDVDGGRGIS